MLPRLRRDDRWAGGGVALLAVFAIATLGSAAFPLDSHPLAHGVSSITAFASMPLALGLLSRAFPGAPGWADLSGWTLAAAVVSAGLLVVLVLVPSGLSQKVFILSWTAWLLLAARRAARNR